MARSKPSSPRARPTRLLASIRPNVRASVPLAANAFELPIRMDTERDLELGQREQVTRGEDGRSPNYDHSTGSLATTRSTTEPSTSSAKLDGQRRLSTILTPTSSEASGSERGAFTSRATSHLVSPRGRVIRRPQSRTSERITTSIDETLLGQGRWAPIHLEPIPDVEFVSGRPSPESPLPQTQSPWSGFPRSDDDGQGGSASPTERRGGRKGGFEKDKAVKVGEMRQIKACLRCLFYRIECDDGDPCAQCRRRMRTWKLPCTRQRLPERLGYLLPGILTDHLQFNKVYAFIGTNAENYLPGQDPNGFHLPLTQFLDEGTQRYLWLQVREVEPLGQRLLQRPGFSVVRSEDGPVVQRIEQQSPPLIPYVIGDPKEATAQVSHTLELWLRRFLDEKDSNWQWYVFPKGLEQAWERHFLGQICRLLDPDNEAHAKLEIAMELTFFNHLLTHSFAVPDEHIEWLYHQKLQHPQYKNRPPENVEVCPRAVNTWLAMIVLHKVEIQAEGILEHINKLFASRDDSMLTGILAFSESFLFIMVLAQLQNSVLERSKLDSSVYETTITVQDAKRLIKTMEDELATPVIELCVFKLRKVSKKRKAARSIPSDDDSEAATDQVTLRFFDNLRRITELCGATLNEQTELGEVDEKTFGATNVPRLLKRLYDAISPFFPPAGLSDVLALEFKFPK